MVEARKAPVIKKRVKDVLPVPPPHGTAPVDRHDKIPLDADADAPERIVGDLIRRGARLHDALVLQRGFAPPPLLFQDQEIDPQILGVRAAGHQRHHLGRPPHLGHRSHGLVAVLAREDDGGTDLMRHPRKQRVRPRRVGVQEFHDVSCPKEERIGNTPKTLERTGEPGSHRLEEGVGDKTADPCLLCRRKVLRKRLLARHHDRGRPGISHRLAHDRDIPLVQGEHQVGTEERRRDEERILRIDRQGPLDTLERRKTPLHILRRRIEAKPQIHDICPVGKETPDLTPQVVTPVRVHDLGKHLHPRFSADLYAPDDELRVRRLFPERHLPAGLFAARICQEFISGNGL